MNRAVAVALLVLATGAWAQSQTAQQLTPEEQAFARLPADLRQMLSHVSPAQAMQTIAQAGQHAIATGNPQPTPEQFRGTLGALLAAPYGMNGATYVSASAGAASFPPLSPLVAPPPPPFLR
jgi:hypothetical protein